MFFFGLLVLFIKSKGLSRVLLILIFGLMFVANISSFIYLIFSLGTIIALKKQQLFNATKDENKAYAKNMNAMRFKNIV